MTGAQLDIVAAHHARFGKQADATSWAPGRVNLLGEHTDYNGGYVLPIALKGLGVSVAVSDGRPGLVEIRSETFNADTERQIDETRANHWSDYIIGCVAAIAHENISVRGLCVTVKTSVPLGAGLSSSAALEVATLRAVAEHFGVRLSPVEIALVARKVENEYVGVPCGIMDQFASSVGEPGKALFLNTRTLAYEAAPGLPEHAFVVIDSGVRHQLTDGGYGQRVSECEAARKALGVEMLSDLRIADFPRIDTLPEPLNRRARHIVLDNDLTERGLEALQSGDAQTFGELMIQSHATERDNYEITVPETDALANAALSFGALGARQTGGGWGGAVVALVPRDIVEHWTNHVTKGNLATRILAVT